MANTTKSGEDLSHSPMTISIFNEELRKEAPQLFEQLHELDSKSSILSSEKNFLEALKQQAPKLYERLKDSNFKFKLDENMFQDWQETIDHSRIVTEKLKDTKSTSPQGNKK